MSSNPVTKFILFDVNIDSIVHSKGMKSMLKRPGLAHFILKSPWILQKIRFCAVYLWWTLFGPKMLDKLKDGIKRHHDRMPIIFERWNLSLYVKMGKVCPRRKSKARVCLSYCSISTVCLSVHCNSFFPFCYLSLDFFVSLMFLFTVILSRLLSINPIVLLVLLSFYLSLLHLKIWLSYFFYCSVYSVTRKSLKVYKSCPKMISLEKCLILTPIQKLPKNVRDLGKLIVAKG